MLTTRALVTALLALAWTAVGGATENRVRAGAEVAANDATGETPPSWRVGIARRKITPRESMWLSGYASRDRPSEGTLTDLWAKCLVLEDPAGRRAVLVTLDLIGIDRALSLAIRSRIAARHALRLGQIALATSHTHTGPIVGENLTAMYFLDEEGKKRVADYARSLAEHIEAVVDEAIKSIGTARVKWTVGTATFAVNRRENRPESRVPEWRAAGTLKGPVDHDVPILAVEREGKIAALAVGYACHCTTLSSYEWSGDYAGFAQLELETMYPGSTALFWAGCGADINPLPRRSVELARRYGRELAEATKSALDGSVRSIAGDLRTRYAEIDLAFAEIPSAEVLRARLDAENRYEAARARYLLREIERRGRIAPSYPYPIQTWRLGDGPSLVFLGGEVVVDYALRLKRELGGNHHWIAAYTNDVMAYIPSRRVLAEGGYEGGGAMVYYGLPSPWDESVEERIVAEVLRQMNATERVR